MLTDAMLRCQVCGSSNAAAARFCNQCAKPLADGPAALAPSTAAGAERKQVTVLFSDLTGFTALTETLDPEETRQVMGRIFSAAAEVVGRYEGRVEKFIGDAIMAIFGVPLAHEDDPQRAVRAALELHEMVARLSPEIQARTGTAISLHSGVNTGVVVTGEVQFDHGTAGPLGDTINVAARLMNAAPSGEIWVGPETRRLIARDFDLIDLGAHDFKGKAQANSVARVLGLRSAGDTGDVGGTGNKGAPDMGAQARQFHAAFIGRQAELGALLGAAEKMRDGQPQSIGVYGDAGTGKTRLVNEFRAKLGADVQWLEGRAYPYAKDIPYAPLIDLLSRVWRIEEADTPAQLRAKVEGGVAALLGTKDAAVPLFLHLYHLEQAQGVVIEREAFQARLLAAMQGVLAALAKRAPTVICLQDLHWADPSTVTLLAKLVEGLSSPLLLLVNYRPGYAPPPGMQTLGLSELSPRQSAELLASLLSGEPPAPLVGFVAERCDGNPFYVEEVVNSLVETGVLLRTEQGWSLTRPLLDAGVPATIRGVIAARIDRLDDTRRRLLRHASVVGREFMVTIVALVSEDAGDLRPSLNQLQAADLIRQRRLEPELEYMFKHALTQDVAYDGLLKTERQALHARTARAMEGVFADRIPEFVETLAYHYQRGGLAYKAIQYLVMAGSKCVERYALVEAENHFRAAYALLPADPRSPEQSLIVAKLLNAWSQVDYYQGTMGSWVERLEKHLPDAERCGDVAVLAMYLGWLGNVRLFRCDVLGSLQCLDRALELGQAVQARDALAYVHGWRTYTLMECGRIADAIASVQALDQTDEERRNNVYPYVKSQSGLALALSYAGDLRQAREVADQLVAFGRATGSARAEALGHTGLAAYWVVAGDSVRGAAAAEAGVASAKDPLFRAMNAFGLAGALLGAGQDEAALDVCNEWLPYLERNRNDLFGMCLRRCRAVLKLKRGQLSEGFRELLADLGDQRARGMVGAAALSECSLLGIYTAMACSDAKPRLGPLLRNPWFVFTQAPFAARRARVLIERLRVEFAQWGGHGLLGMVDLCDAQLLVREGKTAQARECLERIEQRLREAGIEDQSAPLKALAAQIRRRG